MGKVLVKLALKALPEDSICRQLVETDDPTVLPSSPTKRDSKRKRLRAFLVVPDADLRVVVIGQDPYPQEGKATGLAFEVAGTFQPPPKRGKTPDQVLEDTLGSLYYMNPRLGRHRDVRDLEIYARRGVLWLNMALTVPCDGRGGHLGEWENWASQVLEKLKEKNPEYLVLGAVAEDLLWRAWGKHPGKKLSGDQRRSHRAKIQEQAPYVYRIHPSPRNKNHAIEKVREEFDDCWGMDPKEKNPFEEIDKNLQKRNLLPVFFQASP